MFSGTMSWNESPLCWSFQGGYDPFVGFLDTSHPGIEDDAGDPPELKHHSEEIGLNGVVGHEQVGVVPGLGRRRAPLLLRAGARQHHVLSLLEDSNRLAGC